MSDESQLALPHALWAARTEDDADAHGTRDADRQPSPDEWVMACYRDHAWVVLRYLTRAFRSGHVAEDTLQEAFLRLHQARVAGELIDNPRAWLLAVAKRIRLDRRKKEFGWARRVAAVKHDLFLKIEVPAHETAMLDEERRRLRARALRAAFDELKPVARLFLGARAQGLKLREIAAAEWNPGIRDPRRIWDIQDKAIQHVRRVLRRYGVRS